MPVFVEYHGALGVAHLLVGVDHLKRFLSDGVVKLTTFRVEVVDARREFLGMVFVCRKQQSYRVAGLFQTSCGVDTRSDKEHQVADCQLFFGDVLLFCLAQHCCDARTRVFVELDQAEVCQDTVFTGDRNDVGRDANRNIVKEFVDFLNWSSEAHRQCGDEFEAHSAAREFLVRIFTVGTFRVEHRHGVRNHVVRTMMVADYEVDATLVGVFDFLHSLDAAVEHDDETEAVVGSIVDAFI